MNEITLEKLDVIRERTGLGYKEAKDLLEQSNGEIMEALIAWEADKPAVKATAATSADTVNDVVGKLKDALADGQVKAAPYVEAGIKFLKNKYFK